MLKKIKEGQPLRFVGEFQKIQEEYRRVNNQVRGATRMEIKKTMRRKLLISSKKTPRHFGNMYKLKQNIK